MRLSEHQINAIKTVTEDIFGAGAKVRLFGSRVEDAKRGGDIDLYISDIELDEDERFDAKIRFLVELKRKIGEQRVDVVLAPAEGEPVLLIHRSAVAEGVLL